MRPTRLALPALLLAAAASVAAPDTGKEVGQRFPDLALPTLEGDGLTRLSSFRGQKVLLVEFASW